MLRRSSSSCSPACLVVAAFSTGAQFLFFLLYLGILVVGGSYVLTRFGLADLEAGYVLDRLHAQVGDTLRATYTVRNTSRLPKPWLEVHNPSTLPVPLPGRALALGPRGERSWSARVPLTRRGHYRVEPLVIRTGDPFGFFESYATVGKSTQRRSSTRESSRCPAGACRRPRSRAPRPSRCARRRRRRTRRASGPTPRATRTTASTGRAAPGRPSCRSRSSTWSRRPTSGSSRPRCGRAHRGRRRIDARVRRARGRLDRRPGAAREPGAGHDRVRGADRLMLPADRGPRQYQKVMQLLAAVQPTATRPFDDVLVEGVRRACAAA
jgi:hypothetical protein